MEGKPYTVHQVKQGETFYSIAQTYKIQVDSLRTVNRLTDVMAAIRPGDMLVVPLYATKPENPTVPVAPVVAPPVVPPANNTKGNTTHTVVTGETLYSVARLYPHTTVAAIKELNQLEVEGLSIGQVLVIPAANAPKTEAPKVAPQPVKTTAPVDTQAIYKPSGIQSVSPTAAPNPADAVVNDMDDNATVASFDMKMYADLEGKFKSQPGKSETIKGTAIWMDDPSHENQYRFYAMHKTAPVGTVLKVKNLMNGREVYVKVIGKLASNKSNETIIVKVSGGAARYLNVLDDRFMVEMTAVR